MKRRPLLIGVVVLLLGVGAACGAFVAWAQFDLAVGSFERGDYDGAIAHLEKAIKEAPDSARVRILLGWSLYKRGEAARAKAEFERALRMDPSDPNAFYAHEGLGWIAYGAGDHDRAMAAFGESLRLKPGYHNAHDGLGWSYLGKRDLVRAEANFKTALAQVPDDHDAQWGLAFVAYHRGDWAQAIERFRELVRRDDRDTLSRSGLGWSHYFKGDYPVARQIFLDLARREPTWADPLAGLAWIAERQGRPDEAKAGFRKAIEKSAAYVATPDLRKLLAGRPEWVDLWRDLGWALYHQRAFLQSEAEFRALLERHPNDPDGLRGLGYTLYALKRYREAIAPLQRSLATRADLPVVRERVEIPGVAGLHVIVSDTAATLAWTHYHAGDLPDALKHFREVTRRHPDWADSWSGLGWTLFKLGDRKESERAFRRSLEAQPNYPDALNGLQTLGRRS
ncbi:MAG TPA: tetratricopeptide repeat protein [Methylomirabilota bacterium]|nr:tetratricopeptide repeat protein [Methylomirabilota bacterium]